MTEFLNVDGGRLAYEVSGEGPLIVLAHGMGDGRGAFRHLAPLLVEAGHRVAAMDIRGHGESSVGWPSYTRTDVAGDLAALIRHLGGPAVVVGHSFSGGSATIVAARHPELVSAVVELGPFTRAQKIDLGGLLRNPRHRSGMTRLMGAALFRSAGLWKSYLDVAYPGVKPADHTEYVTALQADLRRPGRMAVVGKMGQSAPVDAGECLAGVRCRALVVMGRQDPDWPDPEAEANGIVAGMAPGVGRVAMIEGAGHYPHAQYPAEVAHAVLGFLKD
ncbi:alpha/beta fold hydrolase [Nonomuraea cavernae]|uniref:Hydrolase n=1 Tax=Nonomuraea cavernae TaxID=2045107 RepID=A0A918DMA5_9ACTN|nr:alpha/beta hydrolase [Nonomuraea cavernae]MCA2187823.1 alpha/beta hydrolase [Nonomuraea cavernae]GGO71958.1 hydrolase [Nonomuraea cavernae]